MSQWRLQFEDGALKDLLRLSSPVRARVERYLDDEVLARANPRQLGKALQGKLKGLWRYRVGDVRIIARLKDDIMVVLVVDVGNRREVYR